MAMMHAYNPNGFTHFYKPTQKVTYDAMQGYKWCYVEAPPVLADQMGGIPKSKWEWGMIATNKMVLESHRDRAGLEQVSEGTL